MLPCNIIIMPTEKKNTIGNSKKVLGKYDFIFDNFLKSGHVLVDPIYSICKQISERSSEWFEYTQTISPKKFIYVDSGETYRNGKPKRAKLFLADMETEKQHAMLRDTILDYCIDNDIIIIMCFEYMNNGNLHVHGVCRSTTNYESHLRRMQQKFKKQFGRNTLSSIRSGSKWLGYIVKEQIDLKWTDPNKYPKREEIVAVNKGIPLESANLYYISNESKGRTIDYYLNLSMMSISK